MSLRTLTIFASVTILSIMPSLAEDTRPKLCPKCNDIFAYMNDPAYWRANPVALAAQLEACRSPQPALAPVMRYCGAAVRAAQR